MHVVKLTSLYTLRNTGADPESYVMGEWDSGLAPPDNVDTMDGIMVLEMLFLKFRDKSKTRWSVYSYINWNDL